MDIPPFAPGGDQPHSPAGTSIPPLAPAGDPPVDAGPRDGGRRRPTGSPAGLTGRAHPPAPTQLTTLGAMPGTLFITGDAAADTLLNSDGLALLVGMLLDQQVPMEWAFHGPATLRARLGPLDAVAIAAMDVESFVAVCCDRPAIHRFPAAMGRRIHELCGVLVASYSGQAENVWDGVTDGHELYARLRALPGFGEEKAQIFLALLAKRQGVAPEGWRTSAGKFGDDVPRSVADIFDERSLGLVREWKRAQKAAKLDKQDRPLPKTTGQATTAPAKQAAKPAASAKQAAKPAASARTVEAGQ